MLTGTVPSHIAKIRLDVLPRPGLTMMAQVNAAVMMVVVMISRTLQLTLHAVSTETPSLTAQRLVLSYVYTVRSTHVIQQGPMLLTQITQAVVRLQDSIVTEQEQALTLSNL